MNEQEERETIAAILRETQPFIDEQVEAYRTTLGKFVAGIAPTIFHDLTVMYDKGRLAAFNQAIEVCRAYGAHDVAAALEKTKPTNVPEGG